MSFDARFFLLASQLRTKNLIGLQNKHYCPYFLAFFCVCYNQIFFNLKNVSAITCRGQSFSRSPRI